MAGELGHVREQRLKGPEVDFGGGGGMCAVGGVLPRWVGVVLRAGRAGRAAVFLAGMGAAAWAQGEIPAVGAEFRPEFQRGVCLAHNHGPNGLGSEAARESLRAIRELGANYVSLSPLGYAFNLRDPRIFGYLGEDLTLPPAAVRQAIRDAHAEGLKVLLNPHIWVGLYGSPGEWRGEIAMRSEEDWQQWLQEYARFIFYWARVAQEEKVELFCVGSEMAAATRERGEDWRFLIRAVRGIYHGPCTYSANWSGELEGVVFWDELEYIGISAYFPIGGGSREERMARAVAVREALAALSRKHNKPVLFVETGFRSVPGAGERPSSWQDEKLLMPDFEEQRLCFEVWLEAFWGEPWFSGLYVWNWFSDPGYRPLVENDFQFRGKPAQEVIESYFKRVGEGASQ